MESPIETDYTARCSCGGVTLRSPRAPILQLTCHCAQCREVAHQPATNFAFFRAAETEVAGPTSARHFVADSGSRTTRECCTNCGEMMTDRTEGFPKIVGVVAERIAPPYAFAPRCHVWLQSASEVPAETQSVAQFQRGMT